MISFNKEIWIGKKFEINLSSYNATLFDFFLTVLPAIYIFNEPYIKINKKKKEKIHQFGFMIEWLTFGISFTFYKGGKE